MTNSWPSRWEQLSAEIAPGNPRVCARRSCGVRFVPEYPEQRFHDDECRRAERNRTRKLAAARKWKRRRVG